MRKRTLQKAWKGITAAVLCVAICVGSILFPTPQELQAAETQNLTKLDLYNGDFEMGRAGYSVRGWHLTSMTSGAQIDQTNNWAANYTLQTVADGNNRMAALSKVGGGYAAMTSEPLKITGNTGYRFTYSYKTTRIEQAANTSDFYGIHAVVQQLDKDGNQVAWTVLNNTGAGKGQTVSRDKEEAVHDFVTEKNAVSIVVYLEIGGVWNVKATVQFDDVAVYEYDENTVVNGDFEATYNGQDGGRAGEKDGPACWTTVSCDIGGEKDDSSYQGNYIAEIVETGTRRVLKQYPKNMTQGYSLIQSFYIPIIADTEYRLTYDVKVETETGGTLTAELDGAFACMWFYNSDKEYIATQTGKDGKLSTCDWKAESYSNTAPANAAYVKIGFYIGGKWNEAGNFAYYYDNVSFWMNNGTNGAEVFNGDGEVSDTGVPGWTMVTTGGNSVADPKGATGNWAEKYTISCEPRGGVDGSNAILVTKQYNYGYAALASSKLKVEKGQTYHLQYSYKMTDFTKSADACKIYPISAFLIAYDTTGGVEEILSLDDQYRKSAIEVTDWTTSKTYSFTPAKDSAYAVLYLGMGSVDGQAGYKVWFDNIAIVPQTSENWTEITSGYEGMPRTDGADFTSNYDIMTVNEGNRKDVLKLYVTRKEGILGAVTYYSEAVPVKEKITYVTTYDFKMTGKDSDDPNGTGAVVILRFLNADEEVLSYKNIWTSSTCPKVNQDWTSYIGEFTVPTGAVSVQTGLVIGGTQMNKSKKLTYYYDNLDIQEKDPSISASELYNQNLLLLGDETAGSFAGQAEGRSLMNVSDASVKGAGFTAGIANRVITQIDGTDSTGADYVLFSAGTADAKEGVTVGTVTNAYDGNYDTTTFAGALEEAFMSLVQTFDEKKIAFVFPNTTELSAYYEAAKSAADKWKITLIDLQDWEELIEPLEELKTFDITEISGLDTGQIWEMRLARIVGEGVTPATDVTALQNLLKKAENHAGTERLRNRIKGYLSEYETYRPVILGATIAENDANRLCFLAQSPEKSIPDNVKLVRMGILMMPKSRLDAGESLQLDNSGAVAADSAYSAAKAEYRMVLKGDDCDPNTVYVAAAYAVYQVDGEEYVLYSDRDYTNAYGTKTAQAGLAEASVYGIAKDIAAQIVAAQSSRINWSYIGGSANQSLISEAQEEGTTVTCYDVLRFVSYNYTLLTQ